MADQFRSCPRCGSPDPARHPAVQAEGEVQICPHAFHAGATDSLGYPLAERPHPDAYYDPMYRSRHSPAPMDGWRFAIRCVGECHDGVGSMAARRGAEAVSEEECPECGGPVEMFNIGASNG